MKPGVKKRDLKGNIGIYKITNNVNGKMYIGSSNNIWKRWNHHYAMLKNNHHINKYLQRSWNKYGEKNFTFEVLEYLNCEDELLEREDYYIMSLETYKRNVGYNLVIREEGKRYNLSFNGTEVGKKVSQAKKGVVFTEEHKAKLSKAHQGMVVSQETREKIRKKMIGREFSSETREKLRQANLGKHRSDETKKKLSDINKGKYKGRLGKRKTSDETILKVRKMVSEGYRNVEIAKQLSLTQSQVYHIKKRNLLTTKEVLDAQRKNALSNI